MVLGKSIVFCVLTATTTTEMCLSGRLKGVVEAVGAKAAHGQQHPFRWELLVPTHDHAGGLSRSWPENAIHVLGLEGKRKDEQLCPEPIAQSAYALLPLSFLSRRGKPRQSQGFIRPLLMCVVCM